ncbi:MAG: hypothetical protein HY606_11395 [Planctomycetes bacterium]|nr:hypothetical protein [Planctomycetota bacterium]
MGSKKLAFARNCFDEKSEGGFLTSEIFPGFRCHTRQLSSSNRIRVIETFNAAGCDDLSKFRETLNKDAGSVLTRFVGKNHKFIQNCEYDVSLDDGVLDVVINCTCIKDIKDKVKKNFSEIFCFC